MITIQMKKFGKVLNGRPAGREAVLRMEQIISGVEGNIILDFSGVEVLTPSFADEFIRGLQNRCQDREIKFQGIENGDVVSNVLKSIDIL